jgi:hypothetical protein
MPLKPERIEMVTDYLIEFAISTHPGFRYRSQYILSKQRKGFIDDPLREFIPEYEELSFDDIVSFWETNIKDMPMVIDIVGNKKMIDMKELQNTGR